MITVTEPATVSTDRQHGPGLGRQAVAAYPQGGSGVHRSARWRQLVAPLAFDAREAMTTTGSDVALDGPARWTGRLGMDPAERSLGQLERAAVNVPTARVRVPRVAGSVVFVHRSARRRQPVTPSYQRSK